MKLFISLLVFASVASGAPTLHQKQTHFAHLLPLLIQQAEALGYEVTVGEAWRSEAMAKTLPTKWYADHGKGIAASLHIQRLAIDLNLFKNGKFLTKTDDYKMLGDWWVKQTTNDYICTWGGNFTKLPDGNHFSVEDGGRQ